MIIFVVLFSLGITAVTLSEPKVPAKTSTEIVEDEKLKRDPMLPERR